MIEIRLEDGASDGPRACKEHAVDAFMGDEALSDVSGTLDEIENAAGGTFGVEGLVPQLGEHLSARGRLVTGLEDDGVSHREGGDDVPVGEVHGEVEWPDDGHDAVRTESAGAGASGRDREIKPAHAAQAGVIGGIESDIDLSGDERSFGMCVPLNLSRFVTDEACHVAMARRTDRLKAPEDRASAFESPRFPLVRGASSGGDGGGNVLRD
jgi:hypothetical protein